MSAQARLRLDSPSSPRAQRRLEQETRMETDNARSCLFSSLTLLSAIRVYRAFPDDRQKEAAVLIREIADRLRRLRGMLG